MSIYRIRLKRLALGLGVFVAAMAMSATAEAKIHIPCTGDRLVKVIEIPKEKQIAGREMHLGYKFPGCFSEGEWVGLSNERNKYYKLNPQSTQALLRMAGRTALPAKPSRWQYPLDALLVEILLIGATILVLGWELIKSLRSKRA